MPGEQPGPIDLLPRIQLADAKFERRGDQVDGVDTKPSSTAPALKFADTSLAQSRRAFELHLGHLQQLTHHADASHDHPTKTPRRGGGIEKFSESKPGGLERTYALHRQASCQLRSKTLPSLKPASIRRGPETGICWGFLAIVALGLATAFSVAIAHAEEYSLRDRLVTAQSRLRSATDEPVDPHLLADAIALVTKGNRDWSAMLLTVAAHESALSARIAGGSCRSNECDGGRAWGLYQVHRNAHNSEVWGSVDLNEQTRAASRLLRSAFYQCKSSGVPWPLATLRAYAGNGCFQPLKGEDRRLATFERLRRVL